MIGRDTSLVAFIQNGEKFGKIAQQNEIYNQTKQLTIWVVSKKL